MSKILGIIGAGQLGRQLAHFAQSGEVYDSVVFFDDDLTGDGKNPKILGNTDSVLDNFRAGTFHELLIGIGYNHLDSRKSFFDKFESQVPFGQLIHHTSWIDPSARLHAGTVIYPGCFVDSNAVIRENTLLNLNCTIAHDCNIGAHSFLAPRVATAGFVSTGEKCFLGINTTIKDNISLISGTISGAGTLFVKDTEEAGLYIGQPAKKRE